MRRFIMRAYAVVAAGVVLGTGGVAGASATAAAPQSLRAVRVSSAGTAHAAVSPGTQLWAKVYHSSVGLHHANAVAISPNGKTAFVTGAEGKADSIVTNYATIAYNTATGAQQWIKLYRGPGRRGCDFSTAVAVSPDGNTVFVTGQCANDYATVAYSAATGAQKWVTFYKGVGALNYANSLAVSPSGKTVFVTGESDSKGFVAKYGTVAYSAATGAQLWAKRYGGSGSSSDIAHWVAVSPDGNTVFVTGASVSSTSTDDVTVAYNAATGAQLWLKRHTGYQAADNGYVNSLAVSPTGGTVYVTGMAGDPNTSAGGYGTIAYNAATGAQLWAERYSQRRGGNALSVAVSPDGSTVYVTGEAWKTARGPGYATVAYNAATGAQLWAKIHVGTVGGSPTAEADSVAVSPGGGTVYVTGLSAARTVYDYATIAYSAATGTQQWIKLYHIPGNTSVDGEGPVVEAVSPTSGTVIVTGGDVAGEWATVAYSG